jgi:GT2 family glycosyltransferase
MSSDKNAAAAPSPARVGLVAIGRNEGERLRRCLMSVLGKVDAIVYVDSGSNDGSVAIAQGLGVEVVNLDLSQPFSAARARNCGYQRLIERHPEIRLVQFVDGDCELVEGWLARAVAFLEASPEVAVVCGRRRERYPQSSVYNLLCDMEWDTPVGEAEACGGDAMMRVEAFAAVGGFRDDLIAGEEPELCLRLRHRGWKIWRIDAEMTLHDANITSFRQWWRRSMRAGHAYANVTRLYHGTRETFWRRDFQRILFWGGLLPLTLLGGALFSPLVLAGFVAYPLQAVRTALRRGYDQPASWWYAGSVVLDKFPGLQGVLQFYWKRAMKLKSGLIEYK